jgi:hypothetical protein
LPLCVTSLAILQGKGKGKESIFFKYKAREKMRIRVPCSFYTMRHLYLLGEIVGNHTISEDVMEAS